MGSLIAELQSSREILDSVIISLLGINNSETRITVRRTGLSGGSLILSQDPNLCN